MCVRRGSAYWPLPYELMWHLLVACLALCCRAVVMRARNLPPHACRNLPADLPPVFAGLCSPNAATSGAASQWAA